MKTVEPMLIFQLGTCLYASRPEAILRIGGCRDVPHLLRETALGSPFDARRGLFCADEGGEEVALGVDQVIGLRAIELQEFRPVPEPTRTWLATSSVAGLVLLDGVPTPIIDIPTLIREQRSAAAREARPQDA